MDNRVNIALVGAGYWGQKLLPNFWAAPQARVRMVCDIHAENRGEVQRKFPEIATGESFEALIADPELDAVVIATPLATHFSLAKAALAAGKHVWVEKPLALKLEEAHKLVQLARVKKRVLFVDHTFLYDPAVTIIREMIRSGELGDIYHLFLQRLNLGRIKRDSNVWWNSAPHDASIVLYLLSSQPTSVSLHGYHYLQPNLEDLGVAVIEMADNTSAFVYHNWLYPESTAKLTVIGSKKLLVYEGKFEKRSITLYDYQVENSQVGKPLPDDLPTTIPSKILAARQIEGFKEQEPLAGAVKDFLESILDDRAPLSNGNFAMQVLAILEAGERSIRANGARATVDTESVLGPKYS